MHTSYDLFCGVLRYTLEEVVQILSIRASTEGLELQEDALAQLGEIGARTSLRYACLLHSHTHPTSAHTHTQTMAALHQTHRYAVQLLTPSRILSATHGRDKITVDEIDEIDKLFYDAKASARHLAAQDSLYLK